jgi:hypothetical protein
MRKGEELGAWCMEKEVGKTKYTIIKTISFAVSFN